MKRFRHGWAVLAALLTLILVSSSWTDWAAEVGVTDQEIVIGAGVDLTGAVANWGVNIKAGMEAMINRVNAAGGVHGRTIKLITYNHVYQLPKAVANARPLVKRDKFLS
jgi:branched-chain amino acid transport system substrate-binding protein